MSGGEIGAVVVTFTQLAPEQPVCVRSETGK